MSGIIQFFEKIQKQILDLQTTINQFQQSWQNFQKFWDLFFTILPWEVLLLLLFSVIFLSIFNSVSPNTPKINLSIIVIMLSFLWSYFWGIFSTTVNYLVIAKAALYILLPVHAFGIVSLGYHFYKKWSLTKKRIQPRDWEMSLGQISNDYNELMTLGYGKTNSAIESAKELKEKIQNLESALLGLKSLLKD